MDSLKRTDLVSFDWLKMKSVCTSVTPQEKTLFDRRLYGEVRLEDCSISSNNGKMSECNSFLIVDAASVGKSMFLGVKTPLGLAKDIFSYIHLKVSK